MEDQDNLQERKQLARRVLQQMPKVDLHRHLEGSLRLQTLTDIARRYGIALPANNTEELRPFVQMTDDPPEYHRFLDKFLMLRRFYKNPEAIFRLTEEAIADAAADGVRYLELRFSPQALATPHGLVLEEVTDWVIEATGKASARYGIKVGLIVTLLRHEEMATAERVARVAMERRQKGILALDLAGDEVHFPPRPFAGIFQEARAEGLGITIHAGEWAGSDSVRVAVEELGAQRIGHGVRSIEDPSVVDLVKERAVTLEICLTSNVQTGVVDAIGRHPLPALYRQGVPVTLNTDDPRVSDTRLSDELQLAMDSFGLDYRELCRLTVGAAQASFLPAGERQALAGELSAALGSLA